jgi:N-acetyl-gamma-glutamyl-phosphate reductase
MINVAIIGASGYTGEELLRILINHPETNIIAVTSETYAGKQVGDIYPNLIDQEIPAYVSLLKAAAIENANVVFVALPHGEAMAAVPGLLAKGLKVIDLSGDFRLASAADYETWYKKPHTAPKLLDTAVYGVPELFAGNIAGADLISNPGCYPTSVLLGAAPLLASGLAYPQDIIVDSLSGVSGAGRSATAETHFCSADENASSYKVGGVHQHIPEMELYLGEIAGEDVKLSFTPHLAPFSRGIYSTIYADLKDDVNAEFLHSEYVKFYADSYFVKVLPLSKYPNLKAVAGSNFCHIGVAVDERCGRAIIVSAIDNLVKGASGQAVQNMNLVFGLPEETGLRQVGLWP